MQSATSLLSPIPALYSVPGFARVAVPAGVVGGDNLIVPGLVGPVTFRFPQTREVVGLLVVPASGVPDDLASLSLEIVDERDQQLFTDFLGDSRPPRQPFAVPCLSMMGRAFHAFPLALPVQVGDRWLISLKNHGAGIINVAALGIFSRDIVLSPSAALGLP